MTTLPAGTVLRSAPNRPASVMKERSSLRTTVDHQRSEFLRRCRARLDPLTVGLPDEARARGGGLRRQDVAAMSGVSASWYTWLEQGRDIRVSDDVLDRISETLRLSDEERIYLFALVQRRPPALSPNMLTECPPDVERMVTAMPMPTVVMNLRCDVLAWNAVNSVLYRDYGAMPAAERNLLEILMIRPVHTMSPAQQEAMGRRLIGRLRYDFSRCADDPKFEALLHRLLSLSPVFRKLWRMPDVALHNYGPHTFTHPRFGEVTFEHTSYIPDGYSTIRVVVCTPHNLAAMRAVTTVNEELGIAQAGMDGPRSNGPTLTPIGPA
jgi:hypothetical protein